MATLVWVLGAIFLLNVLIAAWLVGLDLIERRRLDKEIKEVDTLWRSLTMPQPETAGWGSPLSVGTRQRAPVLQRLPAPPRSVGKASVGLAVAASALWVLVAALGPGDPPSGVSARALESPLQPKAELARPTNVSSAPRADASPQAPGQVSSAANFGTEGVPAAVAAQPHSATAIHLDWAGVTAATGYEVERKKDETQQGWLTIAMVQQNVTSHMDGGLEAGTTYFYRISAITESGALASDVVSATTPAGAVPTATSVRAVAALNTITLTWIDVGDETGYRVELSPDGIGDWVGIGTTGQDVAVYTDTALASGTTYHYRIVATNAAGDSAPSNVVSATTETDQSAEPPADDSSTPSPNGTPAEVPPATEEAASAADVPPATEAPAGVPAEPPGGAQAEEVPPVIEVSVVPEPTP